MTLCYLHKYIVYICEVPLWKVEGGGVDEELRSLLTDDKRVFQPDGPAPGGT